MIITTWTPQHGLLGMRKGIARSIFSLIRICNTDPPSHQDYVYQPFHDVLPYSDFSLTLRVRDVPQLLDLLKAVPYDQLMQYRRSL